jgi:hypothetical protein
VISPSASCKYAVLYQPESKNYAVAAVHAMLNDGAVLTVSLQFPIDSGHVYRAPQPIDVDRVMAMAQTSEAAWKFKRRLEDQDRESPV